jgi:membrane fusion protein, heavy metal efflux system
MSISDRWLKAKKIVPSVGALVFLVGLAVWGHITHWKIGHEEEAHQVVTHQVTAATVEHSSPGQTSAAGADESRDVTNHNDAADVAPTRIRFASPEAVVKSGIETLEVAEHSIEQEIIANGVITYDQTRVAQLSARVPGTVWRIEKQLGQPFKKGDVLAVIEAVDVGKAKAEFLQAVVDYQLKKGIADRLQPKQSFLPERDVYEVRADAREAFIRMSNAQQTLINLGLPIQISDLNDVPDEELAKRIHFLGLPESLTKTLDPVATTFSLVPLVAPLDGVVIGHELSLGEVVSPSAEQIVVADISRMWIRMDVRREDASSLRLGQSVIFTSDGRGTEVHSTISWISAEVDEKTRTVPVRAEVENPLVPGDNRSGQERRLLLANTFGTGHILVREVPHAAVIPKDAVQWEGNRWVVFLKIDETTFEARPVEIGISRRNHVEIRTGLTPGDTIATTGSHLLKSEIVRSRLAASQ